MVTVVRRNLRPSLWWGYLLSICPSVRPSVRLIAQLMPLKSRDWALVTLINWLNGTFNGSYVGGTRRGALLCAWRRSSPRRLPHAERIA